MANVTFEHAYVNAAFEYLKATDQTLPTAAKVESNGYSIWATPRLPLFGPSIGGLPPVATGASWEGLLRYDHFNPDAATDEARPRTILGLAYWFPHSGNMQCTLMLDYDGQTFNNFPTAQLSQRKIAIHGQILY